MHPHPRRSVDQLVGDQVGRWQLRSRERVGASSGGPLVTVSRLPGSGGGRFARRLAEVMHLDFFDKELVHRIAESAHLSEELVRTLDERVRNELSQWLMMLERDRFLFPHQYLQHLAKIVGTISKHRHAVIVGRGAGYLLGPGEALRVLVLAPLEVRVRRVAEEHGIDLVAARRHLTQEESDRRAFIQKYFHADLANPLHYDVVFNTAIVDVEQAVAATRALLEAPPGLHREPQVHETRADADVGP